MISASEVWEAMFFEQLVGGVSYLRFETPPERACVIYLSNTLRYLVNLTLSLDIGCGTKASHKSSEAHFDCLISKTRHGCLDNKLSESLEGAHLTLLLYDTRENIYT